MKQIVDSQSFFKEVDRISTILVSRVETSLRNAVLDTYNRLRGKPNGEMRLKLRSYKEKNILREILLIHYLPEDIRSVLKLEMEGIIATRVPIEDQELFYQFLENLGFLKCYILDTSRFFKRPEEFFGWLSVKNEGITCKVYFYQKPDYKWIYNPIKHSRHRGYRDKGALGSSFTGDKEWKKDYLNRLEEEEREEREKLHRDKNLFIKGFIE